MNYKQIIAYSEQNAPLVGLTKKSLVLFFDGDNIHTLSIYTKQELEDKVNEEVESEFLTKFYNYAFDDEFYAKFLKPGYTTDDLANFIRRSNRHMSDYDYDLEYYYYDLYTKEQGKIKAAIDIDGMYREFKQKYANLEKIKNDIYKNFTYLGGVYIFNDINKWNKIDRFKASELDYIYGNHEVFFENPKDIALGIYEIFRNLI